MRCATALTAPAPRIFLTSLLVLLLGACATAPTPQKAAKSSPARSSANGPTSGGSAPPPKSAAPAKPASGNKSKAPERAATGNQLHHVEALAPETESPGTAGASAARIDFNAVDQALAQLPLGNIAYNAPPTMFKDESHPISVILSPAASADQLAQQLHTLLGSQENVQTAQIQVSPRMQATLTGEGFRISPKGPQIQAVSALRPTEWDWTVSPTETGNLNLQLVLEAILDLPDGTSTPRRMKTFTKVIQVRVQTLDVVKGFVGGNWQWLWSTLLIPAAGYFWQRRRKTRRRISHAKPNSH